MWHILVFSSASTAYPCFFEPRLTLQSTSETVFLGMKTKWYASVCLKVIIVIEPVDFSGTLWHVFAFVFC